MTTDDIIKKRHLSRDDVDMKSMGANVDFQKDKTYAFCAQYRIRMWTYSDIGRFSIIGYYPEIDLYLIKRNQAQHTQSELLLC